MGPRQDAQGSLFYEFVIEDHVPQDHILRALDRSFDLSGFRQHLSPYYNSTGSALTPRPVFSVGLVAALRVIVTNRGYLGEIEKLAKKASIDSVRRQPARFAKSSCDCAQPAQSSRRRLPVECVRLVARSRLPGIGRPDDLTEQLE